MAIYEPASEFNRSIGKDIPAMGPFKNYKPNLIGPAGGKIKALIRGGVYVGSYFSRNPRFAARIAAVGVGYGVSRYASSNKYGKAYSPKKFGYNRKRSNNKFTTSKCCCCS